MNKSIPITANISIEIDYRHEYGGLFAPKFGIYILQEAQRITHFWERPWESLSAKYIDYPTEPYMFVSYVPEERLAYYITDGGLQKLVKPFKKNNFDFNYHRIQAELLAMEKEFNLKYGIVFDRPIVQIIYDLFKNNYVGSSSCKDDGIYTRLKGTRTIKYSIDKNLGIIIQNESN